MNFRNHKLKWITFFSIVIFLVLPVPLYFSRGIGRIVLISFILFPTVVSVPTLIFQYSYKKFSFWATFSLTIISALLMLFIILQVYDLKIDKYLEKCNKKVTAVVVETKIDRGKQKYIAQYVYNNNKYKTWNVVDFDKNVCIGDSVYILISDFDPRVYKILGTQDE
jgi:hypothetical protein